MERATALEGPWKNISGDFDISYNLYFYPMFTDSFVVLGESYYYRVAGKNESGLSAFSNVIGPIRPETKMIMDNFSLTYSRTSNLSICSESWPRLRQTEEDFFQVERIKGADSGEIMYKAESLRWIEVILFNNETDDLSIQYSLDGNVWRSLPEGSLLKTYRESYPSQISKNIDNQVHKYNYHVPALSC